MKLKRTGRLVRCLWLAVVVATASCGDVVRSGDAPVMMVVNSLTIGGSNTATSDVSTGGIVFSDLGEATLGVIMKDISVVAPSTNNSVTINRYRVEYVRADGRNVPGVDVPYAFDGAATTTIPAGGTATMVIELVRHTAKLEAPLVNLVTDGGALSMIARVTFFGTDQVGNDVMAVGSMQITFGDFAGS
ncbi:MAG TPA: hypothetical protein VM818_01480 [Vicinamibacterales bacterium]|jgi:hypothetical protein|nr:hypothetical protein [Vicinamibacterales bacterium]